MIESFHSLPMWLQGALFLLGAAVAGAALFVIFDAGEVAE